MATFTEVPVFVKGEPGFAAKLNQLGAVMREVTEAMQALGAAVEAMQEKTPARKAPARKTAAEK